LFFNIFDDYKNNKLDDAITKIEFPQSYDHVTQSLSIKIINTVTWYKTNEIIEQTIKIWHEVTSPINRIEKMLQTYRAATDNKMKTMEAAQIHAVGVIQHQMTMINQSISQTNQVINDIKLEISDLKKQVSKRQQITANMEQQILDQCDKRLGNSCQIIEKNIEPKIINFIQDKFAELKSTLISELKSTPLSESIEIK